MGGMQALTDGVAVAPPHSGPGNNRSMRQTPQRTAKEPLIVRRRQRGFTLIEMMIAMVVIAILAAIAFPSFQDQLRKSRRADGFAALALLQQAQERWRANNPTYTDTLSDLGITSATSNDGYYTIAITGTPTATSYTATATAVTGESQANDSGCTTLTVTVTTGNADPEPDPCWNR
jgi:type IV pilus assembly protein PilE